MVTPRTNILPLRNLFEKLLIRVPRIYRLLVSCRNNTNPDKIIFSHFIKKRDTVIDCGANIGYYTNFFRAIVGRYGHVHAFEPVPSTFNSLKRNILEYSKIKNYTINMTGLYKDESRMNIYIPDSISGHASLNKHNKTWEANKIENIEINLISLDTYVEKKQIEKVNFIKIDIEGTEIDALNGSKLTIQKYKPRLHLEVNSELIKNSKHSVEELYELLTELDYKTIYYYEENPKLLYDFKEIICTEKSINTNIIALN